MSGNHVVLDALTQGDKQAWDRFVRRHARVVFAAVQNRLGRAGCPGRQALVRELLYRGDLEVADAARVLGAVRQTVRSLHHKALAKLRAHFGRDDTEIRG